MYGLTKAVRACTSAKDFVEIVRRGGGEAITGRKSTIHVPKWGSGNWKRETGMNECGGGYFRYFGASLLRQWVFS